MSRRALAACDSRASQQNQKKHKIRPARHVVGLGSFRYVNST